MLEAAGGGLDQPSALPTEVVVNVEGGEVIGKPSVNPNLPGGTWRVIIDVRADSEAQEPMELRAFLRRGDDVLTETWLYRWDWGTP